MSSKTPTERYEDLIREAESFERDADSEATGGPSYWTRDQDRLRLALAKSPIRSESDKSEIPAMSQTAWHAIHYHSDVFDVLRLTAAKACREAANNLKVEIEQQMAKCAETLRAIEKKRTELEVEK